MGTQNYRDLTISNSVIGDGGKLINNNFINLANRIGKCNYSAVVNPTSANNDTNGGYTSGSRWFNLSTNAEFVCVYIDPNTHDATWSKTVTGSDAQIKIVKTDPTGSEYSSIAAAQNNSAIRLPFSLNAVATGLTLNTAIWVDISVAQAGGNTSRVQNLSVSVVEV